MDDELGKFLEFLRDGSGFKLICELESGARELFELTADRHESRNLAGTGLPAEARLLGLLEKLDPGPLRGLDRAAPSPPDETLDPEVREQLRSLGYIR